MEAHVLFDVFFAVRVCLWPFFDGGFWRAEL